MTIKYEKRFKKQYKKLPLKFQQQFYQKLKIFLKNPSSPVLRNHPLKGKYAGYWSMNVNGDIRAIYKKEGDIIIIFALIGTHSELYG